MAVPSMKAMMAAGGGSGPAWTPTDLGSGLFLWLSPADTATVTDAGSGAVSQIDDKSGNGRHHTQATAAKRPLTGTRTINGHNVLDFAGGDDALGLAGVTLAQPYTIAALVQSDATTAGSWGIWGTVNAGFLARSTNAFAYDAGTTRTGGTVGAGVHAVVARFNGVSSTLRVDGVSVSTANPGSAAFSAHAVLFGNITSAAGWDGAIGDVIVTNNGLTGTDLTSLEDYLMNLGGI